METTKCPACGGLMRIRGETLHVPSDADPVWRKLLICTVCAHKSYRPFTQNEYSDMLGRRLRKGK